jgi:OOP family OmpA-OmpF porin
VWETVAVALLLGGCSLLLPEIAAPGSDHEVREASPSESIARNDADRDGVSDTADACVCLLEDFDGFEDADGCPELDNDRDGVVDACDPCPDAPSLDAACGAGCPSRWSDGDRARSAIPLEIPFDREEQEISPRSRPPVLALLAILTAAPELARVRVIGHADAAEAQPEALSRGRADAVRRSLLAGGIDGDRIEIAAMGAAQPSVPLEPAASRWRNRRVSFEVVSLRPPAGPPRVRPPTCDPQLAGSLCEDATPPPPLDVCALSTEPSGGR